MGELFVESDERSSTEEILSVSVANGIYPASESERDTNPGASIANYKIVRVGDIVYNSMRMWQGAVGSSRYNGIVSPAYVVAKPVVELDSTCFGYLLKRPELLYKYLCNSQGNSKDTQTLRYERFAEITAEVPSTIEEQRAISDCLEGLDNLITLHQRKCQYRGLYGHLSWEQRKLGEVAPLQRGFDLPVNRMTPGPYPVVMSNGIGGWHSKYMVKGPGVVTGRSGTIGSLHYIEQNFWPHNTSLWVTSFNGNEPRFIYWLYASIGLERFGSGSGVPTLNRNDVHDLRVGFPCDVVEQRRIGTFFSCLDYLITLHQ